MAFTPSIPEATDVPSQSQSQIKDNFDAINTVVAVNHVAFNAAGEGKHKFAQMPEQGAAPATAANEGAIYTKQGTKTTVTELVFRRESSGTEIEMTAGEGVNGWTMLPSGLLLKWMTVSATAGDQDLFWPTGPTIPPFSAVYQTLVTVGVNTGGDPNIAVTYKTETTAKVVVYNSLRTTQATSASGFVRVLSIGLP